MSTISSHFCPLPYNYCLALMREISVGTLWCEVKLFALGNDIAGDHKISYFSINGSYLFYYINAFYPKYVPLADLSQFVDKGNVLAQNKPAQLD